MRNIIIAALLMALSLSSTALSAPGDIFEQQQKAKRQEMEQLQRINEKRITVDVPQQTQALPEQPAGPVRPEGTGSAENFYVGRFTIDDCGTDKFQWLHKVTDQFAEKKVSLKQIFSLQKQLTNELYAKGYVTSSVIIPEQDYRRNKSFRFLVIPGYIEDIRFKDASMMGTWRNAFPCAKGDILNSYALEQGLEQMRRAGNQDVKIDIKPSEKPGQSVVVLDVKRSKSWTMDLSWDDAGQKATGRKELTGTLTLHNPTGLNDVLVLGYTQDTEKHNERLGVHNNSFYYSLPYKGLTFTASKYYNTYRQTTAMLDGSPYQFEGKTDTWEIGVNALLHRDRLRKTEFISKLIRRHKRGYDNLNGRLESQELNTAAFQVGINHRQYEKDGMLNLLLYLQKGIPGFGSEAGWEDATPEGQRTRYAMLGWSLYYGTPFKLGSIRPKFSTAFRGQYTKQKLYGADHMSIGGRYSVRGYDGENTLSAENGYVWRNELAFQIPKLKTEFYLGADYGRVWGPSDMFNIRDYLIGAFGGLRGKLGRQLSYDIFIGTPIHKPDGFKAGKTAAGFNINLSY